MSVEWHGLEEYQALLKNFPASLVGETAHYADDAVNGAAVAIRQVYGAHRRSGNLQKRVTVSNMSRGQFVVGKVLKSTAPHAALFEYGSQARHTNIGANRGSMPATPTFVPTVQKFRRGLYAQVTALLVRHGAVVSGNA
jgi:hypothetical protein